MAGTQNLISIGDRTTTEQQEITRKGGIASGKARREKRDRHQRIKDLFALAVTDPKIKSTLLKMGIDVTNADLETAMDARVAVELLKKGDYKAFMLFKTKREAESLLRKQYKGLYEIRRIIK